MEKESFWNRLPRWLRIVLIIASIVTVVYWLFFVIYKILCGFRVFGAFVFDKRNYWTFLFCVAILTIGTLLVAQFCLGLDPFGKFYQFILNQIEWIKQTIANKITG